jgi:LysR family glycine cleavage system transcriptional activator
MEQYSMATSSPTLDELRAVYCAARTLNFSVAARQLGMTPSAVSRQVARAEGALEVMLFSRVGRHLELTQAGRMLVDRVGPALQRIDTACLELKVLREGAHLLSLSCVPTFATRWLVPRLPSFLRAHPGLTLSFRPHLQPGEPFPEDLDVAVRYGDGLWADVHSDYIDGRLFIVVASAELARSRGLQRPADVCRCVLLQHAQAPQAWSAWARQHLKGQALPPAGPVFEQYAVLIQAVASGLGLALVPAFLVAEDLRAGTLVAPVEAAVELEHAHHLCIRPSRMQAPPVQAFRSWILSQKTDNTLRDADSSSGLPRR